MREAQTTEKSESQLGRVALYHFARNVSAVTLSYEELLIIPNFFSNAEMQTYGNATSGFWNSWGKWLLCCDVVWSLLFVINTLTNSTLD